MKAVLQYRASPGFRDKLAAAQTDWLSIAVVDETDKARFAVEMQDAEVLLHVLEPVTAAVIEAAPKLRFIQKIGVGVDTIDLDTAQARGIAVANMPGTNSRAVAELTLLLMLAALRRLPLFDRATRAGQGWRSEPKAFDVVGEIYGRTVGLVGFGRVAQLLAPMLAAMGARVLATTRTQSKLDGAEWRALADLLKESDVVSLHLPLTPATAGMMNVEAFAAMKDGAVLVNTARGGLVDEAALIEALTSGKLRAAGLDVFASEPVDPSNRLLELDNVVLAPHVAWLTPETLERSLSVAVENCRRLRAGDDLLNRVV